MTQASASEGGDDRVAIEVTAVKMLGTREHTRAELQRKLGARYSDGALIGQVLDDLQGRQLLSDERFAGLYVEQRSRKGFGPLRIRAEMGDRGVPADLAATALEAMDDRWEAVLDEAAQHKFGGSPVADRNTLAKRGRFLEQRGFPVSLIRRYLDRVRDF